MLNAGEIFCGMSLKHFLCLQQFAIQGLSDPVVISVCLVHCFTLIIQLPFNLQKLTSSRMLYGKELYSITGHYVNSHILLISSNQLIHSLGGSQLCERPAHSHHLSFQRKSGHSCCVLF